MLYSIPSAKILLFMKYSTFYKLQLIYIWHSAVNYDIWNHQSWYSQSLANIKQGTSTPWRLAPFDSRRLSKSSTQHLNHIQFCNEKRLHLQTTLSGVISSLNLISGLVSKGQASVRYLSHKSGSLWYQIKRFCVKMFHDKDWCSLTRCFYKEPTCKRLRNLRILYY